jgi:hypothetical protein
VIDGELISFSGLFVNPAQPDTINPPVTTGHANNDAPAYLYLCGGRNAPCLNYSSLVPGVYSPLPVALIASLTPPDALGFPMASLATATPVRTFPRAACCYIGVYFCAPAAVTNIPAYYDGDWIRAATLHNFEQLTVTLAAAAYTAIPMPTVPATSTAMRVRAIVSGGASSIVRVATAADDAHMIIGTNQSYGLTEADTVTVPDLYYKDLVSADTLTIRCCGFNMNIPRLAR